ncbi:class I SAM-dependent methyltransferase [Parvibaculum sp.]|uniref:class I SAM-dependent methyltransferase n=1 Tax=Parvibaculum sp. TaxID=2024848 RepID=UPI003210E2CB
MLLKIGKSISAHIPLVGRVVNDARSVSRMTNVEFQDAVVEKTEGWLNRFTSLRTMDILDFQHDNGIGGPLMEIGVFCGKYFSLLARSAQRNGDKLLGIDTFQWRDEKHVLKMLSLSDETLKADVTLWHRHSSACSTEDILSQLGGKARFISIDGSHECDDVFLDLQLCENLVAHNGIIAADDFLNPLTLGVNEAIHKFFAVPRLVVPVAYISNKLFLAHRASAAQYKEMLEAAILADEVEPQAKNFRAQLAKGRHFVEQPLWGQKVVVA